ncbi:MAG: hypothetical protein ABI680_18460 [Chthoniobacteraceae bacterium]
MTLLLGGMVAMWRYLNRDEILAAAIARTHAELQATIIPQFELKDASFAEVVAYLETEAHRAGFRGGTRFTVLSDEEVQKVFRRRLSGDMIANDSIRPNFSQGSYAPKVTLSLTDVPVTTALFYVSSLTGCVTRFAPDGVEFACVPEEGTIESLIARTILIRPEYIASFLRYEGERHADGSLDLRPYFQSIGVTFYEGTSARFDPVNGALTIQNTDAQFDIVKYSIAPECIQHPLLERIRWRFHAWFYPEGRTCGSSQSRTRTLAGEGMKVGGTSKAAAWI